MVEAGFFIGVAKKAIKETVKEVGKEITNEVMNKGLKIGKRELINSLYEIEKNEIQSKEMAKYLTNNNSKYTKKIEIAAKNPATRRALFNEVTSNSGFKGYLNECENGYKLSKLGEVRSEIKVKNEVTGNNNILDHVVEEVKNPAKFTKLLHDNKNGFYLKDMILRKGESVSMECKDGDFNKYIFPTREHIVQQLEAGKQYVGGRTLLQITPKCLEQMMENEEKAKIFVNMLDDNYEIIVSGVDHKEKLKYLKKAIDNLQGGN